MRLRISSKAKYIHIAPDCYSSVMPIKSAVRYIKTIEVGTDKCFQVELNMKLDIIPFLGGNFHNVVGRRLLTDVDSVMWIWRVNGKKFK